MFHVMLCPSKSISVDEAKALMQTGAWVAEKKHDGVRAYITNGKLYDRRNQEITKQFPEFTELSRFDKDVVIDGEIVAASGVFEDISGRMHLRDAFKIRMSAKMYPAIFIAFDVTYAGDTRTQKERNEALELVALLAKHLYWFQKKHVFTDFDQAWQMAEDNNWEGLVLKRLSGKYQLGVRSPDCRKLKRWKEETVEFTDYEVNPRGITLSNAKGQRVALNGKQAQEIVKLIKEKGVVVVEVQYLPQASGVWRMPSFRKIIGEKE